ncbi:hypothetical protein M2352_003159 [Azospirillum fermentarium]|uniref:putative metalloprotease CJM1_0395 family protein n=1 Tax=Azospirillum fermentarium TaxID=1233114 RepID=UPI0022269E32|nr:putative metalloprotease CJM1_0395 family protein [Azospirillum fermentarium]MCW2247525.1 hypothetical protein [Azospirillum fermentarium]
MGLPAVTSSAAVFKALPARTARTAAAGESGPEGQSGGGPAPDSAGSSSSSSASSGTATQAPQVQQQIRTLEQTDQKVRAHEQAHQAAGGPHAGGASFTFQKGPDGKNYAVAGEVPIDISRESTPGATITKMDAVKAAALAPADPSSQDRAVAQQAEALKLQAQQEKNKELVTGNGDGTAGDEPGPSRTAPAALAARGTAAYGAAASLMRAAAPTLALSA